MRESEWVERDESSSFISVYILPSLYAQQCNRCRKFQHCPVSLALQTRSYYREWSENDLDIDEAHSTCAHKEGNACVSNAVSSLVKECDYIYLYDMKKKK